MNSKVQNYLTTLTPLRGIAALLVVLYHSNAMIMPFVPKGYTHFIGNCWLWVDFFFILSGFIMSYVYSKNFKNGITGKEYKKYLGARFARVYPLHLITLTWAVICSIVIVKLSTNLDPLHAQMFDAKAAPASLLLVHALHLYNVAPLNKPSWSLSTEWWVYMVFPLLVPFFSRLKNIGKYATVLFIIAFYIVLRYWIGPKSVGRPSLDIIHDFGLFRCLAGFLLGMLLFEFYNSNWGHVVLKNSWSFVLFLGATLLSMHYGIRDILIVAIFPFILFTAAYNQTGIKKILDTRVLQRLGDWSFSIYMVHVPIILIFIIFAVKKNPSLYEDAKKFKNRTPDYQQGVIICASVVILTLMVAALTYRFVEVPARNYLNKQFKTKRKQIILDGSESEKAA